MIVNVAEMSDEQYGLLFDVRRSIRYLDRRRAFFNGLSRTNSFLTILLAGSVMIELAKDGGNPWWLVCIALVASLLSIADLVVGYASAAKQYDELKRRFGELEIAIRTGDSAEDTWRNHQRERLRIEQDEPPVFRALDLLCYQEICRADGMVDRANAIKISWWQRQTRHLFHWADLKL